MTDAPRREGQGGARAARVGAAPRARAVRDLGGGGGGNHRMERSPPAPARPPAATVPHHPSPSPLSCLCLESPVLCAVCAVHCVRASLPSFDHSSHPLLLLTTKTPTTQPQQQKPVAHSLRGASPAPASSPMPFFGTLPCPAPLFCFVLPSRCAAGCCCGLPPPPPLRPHPRHTQFRSGWRSVCDQITFRP